MNKIPPLLFLVVTGSSIFCLYHGIKSGNSHLSGSGIILLGLAAGLLGSDHFLQRPNKKKHLSIYPHGEKEYETTITGVFWLVISLLLVLAGIGIITHIDLPLLT